jgi:lysophospholipid acyltransferase (LPLAT)-like uncharacterized protein
MVREPAQDFYAPFDNNHAVIVALWHGEHFLIPFLGRKGKDDRFTPLTTHHRDGEILTRAGMHLGIKKFLRGAGDHGGEFVRKKALQAFTGMMRELKSGGNVVVTADVPKVARVAGLGIVTLAKYSQCPILPLGMVTSRVHRLSNWDKTPISLPFGRMGLVRGEEIRVPRDADDAALEAARAEVEQALNVVTERAYALARNGKA